MGTATVNAIHGGVARGLGGVIVVLAAGAAFVALGAAPASAAFSRGMILDGVQHPRPGEPDVPGTGVCCPQVAVDADGDAVAVWVHSNDSGNRWSRARFRPHAYWGRLSRSLARARRPVRFGSAGRDRCQRAAIAVFIRRAPRAASAPGTDDLCGRRPRDADHSLRAQRGRLDFGSRAPIQRLGGDASRSGTLDERRARQARTSRKRRLTESRPSRPPGERLGCIAILAADRRAVVAWSRFYQETKLQVQARTISRGGTVGPTRILSTAGMDGAGAQVAINSEGDAVAVWFTAPDLEAFPRVDCRSRRDRSRARVARCDHAAVVRPSSSNSSTCSSSDGNISTVFRTCWVSLAPTLRALYQVSGQPAVPSKRGAGRPISRTMRARISGLFAKTQPPIRRGTLWRMSSPQSSACSTRNRICGSAGMPRSPAASGPRRGPQLRLRLRLVEYASDRHRALDAAPVQPERRHRTSSKAKRPYRGAMCAGHEVDHLVLDSLVLQHQAGGMCRMRGIDRV